MLSISYGIKCGRVAFSRSTQLIRQLFEKKIT